MKDLHTYIYVQGNVDVGAVFNEILQWDLMFSNRKELPEEVDRNFGDDDRRDCEYVAVDEDEPLAAFLVAWYRTDGVAVTEEERAEWEGRTCGAPNCTNHVIAPCHVLVGLSTPVLYTDPERTWTAGNVHSAIIWQLGAWLDGRKIPWQWHTSLKGEITSGYEGLDELPQLVADYVNPPGTSLSALLRKLGIRTPGEQ